MKGWMQKVALQVCKLKGRMDKGGHYDVEMKGWMQKGEWALQLKRRMDMQFKRADSTSEAL